MAAAPLADVAACVFDAYGTLFDVTSAAAHCRDRLGEDWAPLAETWRQKQLQYSWLRSLTGRHVDFWQITGDALDYAMASLKLRDAALRDQLMDLYLALDAYPEVAAVLRRIKDSGRRCAILSNGSPRMLGAAVERAGIGSLLDAVLSVEDAGIFKPHPTIYQLAVDRLALPAGRMSFQSSNAWDAYAAQDFGFRSVWVNRFGQPPERLPGEPAHTLTGLDGLPDLLGV